MDNLALAILLLLAFGTLRAYVSGGGSAVRGYWHAKIVGG